MEVMKGSSGGGCCIARYTTHPNNYYNYPNHVSKMDRIMLRFRPIAPKPTLSGPNSSSDSVGSTESVRPNTAGKRKRKTTGTNTGGKRKNTRSPDDHKSNGGETCHVAMTTLPLLPETPDLSPRKNNNTNNNNNNNNSNTLPTWLSFGPSNEEEVVHTKVTVEGVTDAWLNNNNAMMRCTDEERKRMLDGDTCPGFISDAWNRVWWTNREYRKMVTGGDTWRKMETVVVAVKLEMKDKVAFPVVSMYSAFTAKVRVEYGGHTVVVPCDAWRLDGGGFAWRLDVKAALCLAL